MSWDVDASAEAASFVDYLDTFGEVPGGAAVRRALLASFGPKLGESWLDVGCGLGDDAILLAEMVSPGGRVVAVDASTKMIEECRRRVPRGASVETHVANAQALPFPADTFDGVLANRVLQHVPDPAAAVREMLRVARPGATLALVEPDWASFAVDPSDERTGDAIVSMRAADVANPRVGRDLGALLAAHDAREVTTLPLDWAVQDYAFANILHRLEETAARAAASGAVEPDAAERWAAGLRRAADDGRFAARVTLYIARGRKP